MKTIVSVKMENDYGDKTLVEYNLDTFKSPERMGTPEFLDDVLAYVIKNRTHGDNRQQKIVEPVAPAEPLSKKFKKEKETLATGI